MATYLVCIAILLILLFVASPASAEEQESDLNQLVTGNNTFALDLYSILKKEKGNMFLSPYSISSALAMTYGGARGDTAKEMAEALHFGLGTDRIHPAFAELSAIFNEIQKKGHVQLHIANSLWPQKDYPVLPEYLTLIKQHYGVSITPVDYVKASEQAREIINRWVEDKTEGKIKDLIHQEALNYLTTLVLVNAIYFKGKWASPFDPEDTDESDVFYPSEYREVQVSMMYQQGEFGYAEIKGAQLLELPYIGKQLSMVVILPEKVEGVPEIENRLTEKNLEAWLSRLSQQDVKVYLPKFNVTWGTFDLMRPLQASGMRKAFNLESADFSGIDGTKDLFIGSVFHKTFIEVNEEGTEAAAATAVVEEWGALYAEPALFTLFEADHPFLFLIRDNVTKSILFLGRVVDPGQDQC